MTLKKQVIFVTDSEQVSAVLTETGWNIKLLAFPLPTARKPRRLFKKFFKNRLQLFKSLFFFLVFFKPTLVVATEKTKESQISTVVLSSSLLLKSYTFASMLVKAFPKLLKLPRKIDFLDFDYLEKLYEKSRKYQEITDPTEDLFWGVELYPPKPKRSDFNSFAAYYEAFLNWIRLLVKLRNIVYYKFYDLIAYLSFLGFGPFFNLFFSIIFLFVTLRIFTKRKIDKRWSLLFVTLYGVILMIQIAVLPE